MSSFLDNFNVACLYLHVLLLLLIKFLPFCYFEFISFLCSCIDSICDSFFLLLVTCFVVVCNVIVIVLDARL